MFKKIFSKIVLLYILFIALSFGVVATVYQRTTYKEMAAQEAFRLYSEATSIASTYAFRCYTGTITLETMEYILNISASSLSAEICVVNSDGSILSTTHSSTTPPTIQNFDIASFSYFFPFLKKIIKDYNCTIL